MHQPGRKELRADTANGDAPLGLAILGLTCITVGDTTSSLFFIQGQSKHWWHRCGDDLPRELLQRQHFKARQRNADTHNHTYSGKAIATSWVRESATEQTVSASPPAAKPCCNWIAPFLRRGRRHTIFRMDEEGGRVVFLSSVVPYKHSGAARGGSFAGSGQRRH